jgi:NADH-quinone oxidoreductase subunit F
MTREEVVHELDVSGLRGRGGAGFSMGKKASFMPHGAMDKYLVCNADESEPGTFKDRELMQKSPHMLIEGMVIAAYAVGANRAFIYIRGEYELQADDPRAASRRRASRLPRRAHPRLGPRLTLWVHRGAGAYICGEETALLDSLEGKRGNPRLKPPFPANQGLYQGPTLINNVETLSHRAAHHAHGRRGVREDRHAGLDRHEARVGRRATSSARQLRDRARHPGARDHLRPGRRPARRAARSSSGSRRLERAGAHGRRPRQPYDFDSMAKAGSMLGSGAIIVVDDSNSVVDVALKTAKFYRHESCGKCTPCREGTNWTVKMLQRVDSGEATPMDLDIMASVQEHHRQLPVRAGRRDGDADRLDDRQVPRRVRGAHRGGAARNEALLGDGAPRAGAAGGRGS